VIEPRYTTEDLDAIEQLVSDRERLIFAHVEQQLERRRKELEQLATPELTAYLRGQIAAMRMVLDLPVNLHEGIRNELKEKRRGR